MDPATAAEGIEVERRSVRWQSRMMNSHPIEDLPTSLRTQCSRGDAIGWAYRTLSRSPWRVSVCRSAGERIQDLRGPRILLGRVDHACEVWVISLQRASELGNSHTRIASGEFE